MSAERPWLVPAADAATDTREVLADLFGADYAGRALTPQRSDRAPDVVRAALARFAPWDSRAPGTDLGGEWCVADHGDAGASSAGDRWHDAAAAIHALADRALAAGRPVLALGGDHSVSWPVVERVAAARAAGGRLGVVQIDVHHDVRPLDDGPSNGTPFRGLLEGGTIAPADLVQVGIHPFANRRRLTEYCDDVGVPRLSLDDVHQLGAAGTASRALQLLEGVDAIHLSVDIDVLDRAFAPGTAAALPGGLDPRTLVAIVEGVCTDPRVCSVDVVEFDPERDVASVTAYAVAHVVIAALATFARRTYRQG